MFVRREIITSVANVSRFWLQIAAKEVRIKNLDIFRNILRNRRGSLLTISNHISTMDDPLMWGALLAKREVEDLIEAGQMRWAVGARELTFTNPFTSWFFERGQVIPIDRGEGIYQTAVDEAIKILKTDRWLHYFPEGRVIQYNTSKEIGRLKWGIGRILMESSDENVTILPIFLKGFDWMKPNDVLIPRFNHDIEIVIGEPVEAADLLKCSGHLKDENERRSFITRMIQDLLNTTNK